MRVRILWTAALAVTLCGLALAPTAFASTSYRGAASRSHAFPAMAHASAGHAQHATGKQFHPTDVLYSQYDNPGLNSSSSQDFEASFDAYDDQLADDFSIPSGDGWNIDTVDVEGLYYNGGGPAASFNVRFYQDSGGLPGTMVAEKTAQSYVLNGDDFTISLDSPVSLGEGTWWVAVQARMDFNIGGQFGWTDRSVTSGNGAAWENPGGGFGAGCITWDRKVNCIPTPDADQVFSLSGTHGPPPPPPPRRPPHPAGPRTGSAAAPRR